MPVSATNHQFTCSAGLPDVLLRFQGHRARCQSIRVKGVGEHLFADYESDSGRSRATRGSVGGGAAAYALSSGTSAIFYSIINIAKAGDNIVSANNLYGGTYTQFNDILPDLGITVKFVDPNEPSNFAEAIDENTKGLFCETVSNPGVDIADLEAIAKIAHDNGRPLIVDSTFSTPYLTRPIEFGADVVVHSLTKWFGGHGTGIGGVVVDSGKFELANRSSPSTTSQTLPIMACVGVMICPNHWRRFILRMRTVPLRNLGACLSPDNAWIFLQGIETLPLRMERHCSNAKAVAEHLNGKVGIEWVRYPGLNDEQSGALADKYLDGKGGSMVIFGIEGGADAGSKFIDSLELFSHLANVGDAKSLAIHPRPLRIASSLKRRIRLEESLLNLFVCRLVSNTSTIS